MLTSFDELTRRARSAPPHVALILGSGLGDLADCLGDAVVVDFHRVPGLEAPTVAGHRGQLLLGTWAGQAVLVFAGRLHFYEGHAGDAVVRPVRIARQLGVEILLTTNAVGGIRDDLVAGTLMLLRDQVEATTPLWNRGEITTPGPFDAELRQRLHAAARGNGCTLAEGVYAQVTGPCYETPAEIRALRSCGADAVGMSSAREARFAFALGLRVAAVACVTNRAAGLSAGPIHHGEVLAVARQLRDTLTDLLGAFLAGLDG